MLVHLHTRALSLTRARTHTNKPCYVSGDQKGTENVVEEKGQDIK